MYGGRYRVTRAVTIHGETHAVGAWVRLSARTARQPDIASCVVEDPHNGETAHELSQWETNGGQIVGPHPDEPAPGADEPDE